MPNKRKVAFFLPDMSGGGAERVQLAVIRHLIEHGHEVDLILAFDGGILLPLLPPQVRIIELRAKRLANSLPGLVRYLKAEKPFSLQAIMWPCTVIAVAAKMASRVSTRLILSDHTFLSNHYPSLRGKRMLQVTMRFFYRRAEHRIAVSRGAAEDVAKLAGLPASAVEVVYNPIDFPEVIGRTSLSEQVWQFGSPRIVTAGSLKAEKNHPLLLRAFALLLKHHPEARLLILGEGSLRLRLEALCDELGLGQRVSLPGFQLDLWPFLASADLFVLSSDYEGMSLVIVEAMHAGLRVVSTDCEAGPAELLDNGRYGRLVPVGDVEALARAMIAELATPKNAERQRARAREITGPSNLQRYEELLTS